MCPAKNPNERLTNCPYRRKRAGCGDSQVRGRAVHGPRLLDRDAVSQNLRQGVQEGGQGYSGPSSCLPRQHVVVVPAWYIFFLSTDCQRSLFNICSEE